MEEILKEELEKARKLKEDADFFIELFCYKEPNKVKEKDARAQMFEANVKIELLTKLLYNSPKP